MAEDPNILVGEIERSISKELDKVNKIGDKIEDEKEITDQEKDYYLTMIEVFKRIHEIIC